MKEFMFVNKTNQAGMTKGKDSSKSVKNVKSSSKDSHRMNEFTKQICESLIPKVEFDVIENEHGSTSVNLSCGTKNSLSRSSYKNSKSLIEKHKVCDKPSQYIK